MVSECEHNWYYDEPLCLNCGVDIFNEVKVIQKENAEKDEIIAKLRECVEFYTHEKPRGGYDCEKTVGVMAGHRYDIACGACNEESKGKKARETLKELKGGE